MLTNFDDDEEAVFGSARLRQHRLTRDHVRHGRAAEVLGRMPQGAGMDISEFDVYPIDRVYMTPEDAEFIDSIQGDAPPAAFSSPHDGLDHFPMFKAALRHFQNKTPKPRVVRFDTQDTFVGLIADSTVRELARRVDELRDVVEHHVADRHGPALPSMRKWDVIGAAQAVADLRAAGSVEEALAKLPEVPLDLPAFAVGKVKCWLDGDAVICSLRFALDDGVLRIATAAAQPRVDADEVEQRAIMAGIDPVVVLGALPNLAAIACGKRLVRDTASAALHARSRSDVVGMQANPVMLVSPGADPSQAPLAALMTLQACADKGDAQCRRELGVIQAVAKTPDGQRVAAPLLAEAQRRLAALRATPSAPPPKPSLWQRVAGWLR